MQVGTLMAAAERFWVTIEGRGGHGAMPHLAIDPVVAGAAVVAALQPLVSRETSPTGSAVITVSRFNTGGCLDDCCMVEGMIVAAVVLLTTALHACHCIYHFWQSSTHLSHAAWHARQVR